MDQSGIAIPRQAARVDVVTFGQLLTALRAKAGLIIGVSCLVFVAAFLFVLVVTPRFASETQVLLESREAGYTRTLTERELQGGVFDEQAVASQVQVISSRDVAREAIRRLGLVGNPEFDPLAGPANPVSRVRMMLGASRGLFEGAEEDRIFESYYSRLTVYPVARSRVIAIRFASADPDLAARAANTIAEVYLEQLEEAKADMARAASNWLGTSIEDLRERVSTAEEAVEQFRAESGLFMGGNNATITSEQLSDINTELAQARSAQADSQARARLIRDMIAGGRAFEIPDVANNELIQRLIEQRIAMRSQLALEQQTFLPAHPRIRELRAQVDDLDAQIASAARQTVLVLENDARLAGARVDSLEAALEAQMRVVAQANENEVRLRALEREARAEREQLEAYLTRYREALARGSGNASLPDARVVSRAVVPQDPVFPRKVPTIVLAVLASIFLTAGAIVVAELAFGSSQPAVRPPVRQAARSEDGDLPPSGGRSTRASPPRGRADGSWIARLTRRSKPQEAVAALGAGETVEPGRLQLRGTLEELRPELAPDRNADARPVHDFPEPNDSATAPAPSDGPTHKVVPAMHAETVEDDEIAAETRGMTQEFSQEAPQEISQEMVQDASQERPQAPSQAPSQDVSQEIPQEALQENPQEARQEPVQRAADDVEAAEEDEARAFVGSDTTARQRDGRSFAPAEYARADDFVASPPVPRTAMATSVAQEPMATPVAQEPMATHVAPEPLATPVAPEPMATPVARAKPEPVAENGAPSVAHEKSTSEASEREPHREKATGIAQAASSDPLLGTQNRQPKIPSSTEIAAAAVVGRGEQKPPAEQGAATWRSASVSARQPDVEQPDVEQADMQQPEERFHFERLVERISEIPVEERGRRVLITGLGDPVRLAALARAFSREVSRSTNAILVETQIYEGRESSVGLTNLIADDASFFHAIQQDAGSRLHCVSVGTADPAILLKEPDALEISFCAFDQTYQWVVLALPDVADAALFALLAKSSDSVVLASDEEPSSAKVLALYEAARRAGASQVLVACVGELANAAAA